jgi:hypothetical protein
LRPVLESLVRWGMPLMTADNTGDAVRGHWLAWAIELVLADRRPDDPPVTVELRAGDQPIVLETRDGKLVTRLDPVGDAGADATITGEARPVMGLLLGILGLGDAKSAGVSYVGDPAILERIGPADQRGACGQPSVPDQRSRAGSDRSIA